MMPKPIRKQTKLTQFGIFLVRYWTEIRDGGVSFLDADAQLCYSDNSNHCNYCDYCLYEKDHDNPWGFDEMSFAKHSAKQEGSFRLFAVLQRAVEGTGGP
jgi:hypothetical protein